MRYAECGILIRASSRWLLRSSEYSANCLDQLPGTVRFVQKPIRFETGMAINLLVRGTAQQEDFLFWLNFPASLNQLHPVHLMHGVIGDEQRRLRLCPAEMLQRSFRVAKG